MRRPFVWVLAAFHLLQATWLLQGGIDLLLPRTALVTPSKADDACCVGTCGCPVNEQKRKSCCCFPATAPSDTEAPARVTLSTVAEALCAGVEAAVASLLSQPTLPTPPSAPLFVATSLRLEFPERRPALLPLDRALDKVPL